VAGQGPLLSAIGRKALLHLPDNSRGYVRIGGNNVSTTLIPINYDSSQPGCGPHGQDNWAVAFGFKSRHPGGANFVFGDGSVHFISQDIDYKTYQLLGCRNDGQTVGMP
jgi:prepilin-type processing-associated H-X9-DG protein